jgi:hypothetical protein
MSERSDDNCAAHRFHGGMDAFEIELPDDFLFEPTAWDLASAIDLAADADTDRVALDELADAMLMWADGPETERLTDHAVEALWCDELESLIREGHERVAALGDDWAAACATALVEFERSSPGAPVSRAVVQHLAMQLGGADHPVFFCLDCLDQAMSNSGPDERRALAVRVAIIARRNAAVPDAELRAALAGAAFHPPAGRLATVARREAVRARLGRLGALGRESMPVLAAELTTIAAEPLPTQAEDDDVWQEACTYLLAEEARPELN